MRLHNVSEDTNIGSNCQVISDAVIDSIFQRYIKLLLL